MTDLSQQPFEAAEFAENPEPRCPVVLLLDTSGSMSGAPIRELNAGLVQLRDELLGDSLASKRVDLAIVSFGPVKTIQEFSTIDSFNPPSLSASGDTPMGAAITRGIAMVKLRKETYRTNGVAYYRPWIFVLTDGSPTDAWSAAAAEVKHGEESKSFAFFAVGVEGADLDTLAKISAREPLRLQGLRFRELFVWLSASLRSVSHSQLGTDVPLSNPTGPQGWAAV